MEEKVRILIVEDSRTQAAMLRKILEENCFSVMWANNGKAALAEIERQKPLLILSDVNMPEMTGFELCNTLKSHSEFRKIPFIILTSLSDPQDIIEGLNCHADDFLTKPYNEPRLLSRIQYWLSNKELSGKVEKELPLEFNFNGKKYSMSGVPTQIIGLLLSSYETAVQKNNELHVAMEKERELAIAVAEEKARADAQRERTEELEKAYQQLKDMTAQLLQMEKLSALGELLAGVAHELVQPLNNIRITCQSIIRDVEKKRFDESSLKSDLTDSIGSVDKMAEIINHLRSYTRNVADASLEKIDIKIPIEGVFKLLGQQLKLRNIEILKEFASDLPKIDGNQIELEQVFTNLIINARDALEMNPKPDGMKIWVRAYQSVQDNISHDLKSRESLGSGGGEADPARVGKAIVVEVEDNGIGIPENVKERLFTSFFTTKPIGKGTGLGLSIIKKIIEAHKGKIELKTELNKGTKFSVFFPVEQGDW